MIVIAWLVAILSVSLLGTAATAAGGSPDPSGTWTRGDGNARVVIKRCGKAFCATNIWIKDTSKGEAVGDKLVMNVSPQSPTSLAGTAYDIKRKLTYTMEISVAPNSLSSKGCVAGGAICKSETWSH